MKNILSIATFSIFLFSCTSFMGNYSTTIDEKILTNDITINLPDSRRAPNTMVLSLKEKINCDIQLDFYFIKKDSLIKGQSVKISDFTDDEFWLDWYYKNTVVKVEDSSECTTLSIEMRIY